MTEKEASYHEVRSAVQTQAMIGKSRCQPMSEMLIGPVTKTMVGTGFGQLAPVSGTGVRAENSGSVVDFGCQ